jgi:CRISPR-associated protein Csx10
MIHYTYLPYSITLQSSAIMTSLGGDPNSSRTLTYIPGIALRGAVAAELGDPDRNPSVTQDFSDLVLGGKVRFLNAYPVVNGVRALPTPVSMKMEKNVLENGQFVRGQDLAAYDGYISRPGEEPAIYWPEQQLIPLAQGYVGIGASPPTLTEPKVRTSIHQQRDRQKGKAWKKVGAIFTFESLDEDQTFAGSIQLRGKTQEALAELETRIRGLLREKKLLFGRSRRAAYGGLAHVALGSATCDREVSGSGSAGLRPLHGGIPENQLFRVLLTSPCIIRNPNTGQIDPAALGPVLLELFNKNVALQRVHWSFELVGGFNRKWGLELPQALAVAAGSVLVFSANQAISHDDLLKLEHEGIGERKSEGFGRFLLLDKPIPTINLDQFSAVPGEAPFSGDRPGLVKVIESRTLKAALDKRIEEQAMRVAGNAARLSTNLPTNSLIGRLRNPLRGTDPVRAIETLKAWLGNSESVGLLKRPAMEQLEKCEVERGVSLYSWLRLAMNKDEVWRWLDGNSQLRRCSLGADILEKNSVIENPAALSVKYIDVVLATMAVLNKKGV